jgi:N-methylhydantoinase B/oxoprolinase/acetone carboxylase alpha subunit
MPLANRCQSQRSSIITPKYAFSLLSRDLGNKLILLLLTVVEDYGLKIVQEYMYHIRNNAENSVRNLLREVAKRLNTNILSAVDYLDDGSPARAPPNLRRQNLLTRPWKLQICLRVEINEEDGSAVFDFEGTGCEVRGNLNSPVSVVHSAVIYCIRSMLDVDIPLNAGCLVPLDSRCFSPTPLFSLTLCQFEFPVAAFCLHHGLRQSVEAMYLHRSVS